MRWPNGAKRCARRSAPTLAGEGSRLTARTALQRCPSGMPGNRGPAARRWRRRAWPSHHRRRLQRKLQQRWMPKRRVKRDWGGSTPRRRRQRRLPPLRSPPKGDGRTPHQRALSLAQAVGCLPCSVQPSPRGRSARRFESATCHPAHIERAPRAPIDIDCDDRLHRPSLGRSKCSRQGDGQLPVVRRLLGPSVPHTAIDNITQLLRMPQPHLTWPVSVGERAERVPCRQRKKAADGAAVRCALWLPRPSQRNPPLRNEHCIRNSLPRPLG